MGDSDSDYEQEMEEIVGIMFDGSEEASDASSIGYDWRGDTGVYDDILSIQYDYNSEDETHLIYDSARIYLAEQAFLDSEKPDQRYYIGSATLIRNRYYIMNTAITARTFLGFPFQSVLFYLHESSLFHFVRNRMDIMKLYIHPVTMEYIVVLKTFWLRIVQRTWRRVLRERAAVLRKRCSISNIQHRLIRGRHQTGLNVLPGLVGMLRGD